MLMTKPSLSEDLPECTHALPIVRWVGGKRWLVPVVSDIAYDYLAETGGRYIEPFLGGGAVAADLGLPNMLLADLCEPLINAFQQVRRNADVVLWSLRNYRRRGTDEATYYKVRAERPRGKVQQAAWFFYMNALCFTPGSQVLTEDEVYRAIETIRPGERLWGGRVVQQIFQRHYAGRIYRIKSQSTPFTLSVTAEHPVLSVPGKTGRQERRTSADLLAEAALRPAEELRPGDYVMLPTTGSIERDVDWTAFWPDDAEFGPQAEATRLQPNSALDCDLGRLLGYYAAEGCIGYSRGRISNVTWTFNKNETEYVEDVGDICERCFGVRPHVYPDDNVQRTTVMLCSVHAARFISTLVSGQVWAKDPAKRKTKRLHDVLMTAPILVQLELLKGWLRGDGCLRHTVELGASEVTGTSTVLPLARQLYRVAQRCGFRPSWWVTHPKTKSHPNGEATAQVSFSVAEEVAFLGFPTAARKRASCIQRRFVGPYIAVRIKEVTTLDYSGLVHNVEVDGDHLLCVDGVISHNCFNGVYRENTKGEYNVPYGIRKPGKKLPGKTPMVSHSFLNKKKLTPFVEAIRSSELIASDFRPIIKRAGDGDFVFVDSPYFGVYSNYLREGFGVADHVDLARELRAAAERGAAFIATNNDVPEVRRLYRWAHITRTGEFRRVNRDAKKRGKVACLLIASSRELLGSVDSSAI